MCCDVANHYFLPVHPHAGAGDSFHHILLVLTACLSFRWVVICQTRVFYLYINVLDQKVVVTPQTRFWRSTCRSKEVVAIMPTYLSPHGQNVGMASVMVIAGVQMNGGNECQSTWISLSSPTPRCGIDVWRPSWCPSGSPCPLKLTMLQPTSLLTGMQASKDFMKMRDWDLDGLMFVYYS